MAIRPEHRNQLIKSFIECGFSVLVFLIIMVYFPAKPPLPPTVSASIERVDFKVGVKVLAR